MLQSREYFEGLMPLPTKDDTDMQEVWNELQDSTDSRNREDILIRLAECALRDHDFSDLDTADEVHNAFCAMRVAQAQYEVAALTVGRIVAQLMELENDPIIMPFGPEENPN